MNEDEIYSQTTDDIERFPRLFRDRLEEPLLDHDFSLSTAQAKIKFLSTLEEEVQRLYPEDTVLLEEFQKYRGLFKRKSDMYDLAGDSIKKELRNQPSSSSSESEAMDVDEPQLELVSGSDEDEPEVVREVALETPPQRVSIEESLEEFDTLFDDIDHLIKKS